MRVDVVVVTGKVAAANRALYVVAVVVQQPEKRRGCVSHLKYKQKGRD